MEEQEYKKDRQGVSTLGISQNFRLALTIGVLSLLLGSTLACSKTEPYNPPDLFYYFASYPVGKNPTTVTTGDLNHDSFTDVITTNIASDTLSILLGNGDGTFHDQIELHVCQEPRSLAMGDFNHDEHLDVALACSGGDEIEILLGHGNGKFEEGPHYPVYRTPVSLVSEDVNGDHHADLVVALRNDKVKVFLGNGTGEFRLGPQYEYGDTPTSVALADLNEDGKLDLIVTNGGAMSHGVSVWVGNGDGTFRDPKDYPAGKRSLGVSLADFNNDHHRDLLVINGENDSFTALLGNGNATFQAGKDAGANAGPNFGLARDFNGDRVEDVAIVNLQSSDLSVIFGKGDGTFYYPPRHYKTKRSPFALASFRTTTTGTEEPGFVVADNGSASVSIFLHKGLKRSAP